MSSGWIGGFDQLLSAEGIRWDDGWRPLGLRAGDRSILDLLQGATLAPAQRIRKGADRCDVAWLSQLVDPSGSKVYP